MSWHAICLVMLFLLQSQAQKQGVTDWELGRGGWAALHDGSLKRSWHWNETDPESETSPITQLLCDLLTLNLFFYKMEIETPILQSYEER